MNFIKRLFRKTNQQTISNLIVYTIVIFAIEFFPREIIRKSITTFLLYISLIIAVALLLGRLVEYLLREKNKEIGIHYFVLSMAVVVTLAMVFR
ncbi:hypothetical protein LRR81_10235 [Metabacillus sp. GX 13764]|uniref:hypothetical protein n=1 Tax=Metabacillus kandeliae TaxID=2900151 RepID=UPI001E58B93C|nr:hypothetical protein [Metabacillus kandeliae]MCD7034619.1 hypothetical protein [Metabacillus kandeliae]